LADTRNVEQVIDQANQMNELPIHYVANFRRVRAVWVLAQDVQAVAKRGERVAQFVRQRGEKLILAAVGLFQRVGTGLELVALGGDLLPLAVPLEKYVRLAAPDVRFDRFVNEVDSPGFIAAKAPLAVGVARRYEDDRHPP